MRYFIIAGEASGDLHGSNLMKELKKQDSNAEFCFLGGDKMAEEGGKLVEHYRNMAFMGFIAVIKNAKIILKNLSDTKKAICDFKPDVVILIDYPSFNLRIAKFVKQNLKNTPVYYYISPKIWAWKEFRIKQIKKYIDEMFTIFPFETEFYKKHNYRVTYVGNPTVDSIASRPTKSPKFKDFIRKNSLPNKPIIAILPGSRKQEISACLHKMVEAADQLEEYQTVVCGAPGIENDFYDTLLPPKTYNIVFNQTYELLNLAKAAVVNSGTATLETALLITPQVVVYHVPMGKFAILVKNLIIKTKFISLVNIIAQKEVVKELLANQFTVENIKDELILLLYNDEYRYKMILNYRAIEKELGESGTAERAAKEMISSLSKNQAP